MQAPKRIHTQSDVFEVRETNNYPVLAICSDFNTYVIKHNRGRIPANKLAVELVASYFLKLFEIPIPLVSLIDVDEEHIMSVLSNFCQPAYFKIPCFGSKHLRYGMEMNDFLKNMKTNEINKFISREILLKIAFFDIWMANDDRTPNNPNLLINPEKDGYYYIYAIDHEGCFNTGNLHRGLYTLDYNSSIFAHQSVKRIIGKLSKNKIIIDNVIQDCYFCIENCHRNLNEILSYIPDEWGINVNTYRQLLISKLFSNDWIQTVKKSFLSFLQLLNH